MRTHDMYGACEVVQPASPGAHALTGVIQSSI